MGHCTCNQPVAGSTRGSRIAGQRLWASRTCAQRLWSYDRMPMKKFDKYVGHLPLVGSWVWQLARPIALLLPEHHLSPQRFCSCQPLLGLILSSLVFDPRWKTTVKLSRLFPTPAIDQTKRTRFRSHRETVILIEFVSRALANLVFIKRTSFCHFERFVLK